VVLLAKEMKQAAADAGDTEMVAAVKEAPMKASKTKPTQKRLTIANPCPRVQNIGRGSELIL
jgi:hypothetical protein